MFRVERILNKTDQKYGIICAGAKFDVGMDKEVTVIYDGKHYPAKMHKTSKGRIDGLSELYNEYPDVFRVGSVIELEYDEYRSVVNITLLGTSSNHISILTVNKTEDECIEDNGISTDDNILSAHNNKNVLEKIFKNLDKIAKHTEYFRSFHEIDTNILVNNEWIVYGGIKYDSTEKWKGWWLYNEKTGEEHELPFMHFQKSQDVIIPFGFNNAGVWYIVLKGSYRYVFCIKPSGDAKSVKLDIVKNRDSYHLCFEVYVYDNLVYYIKKGKEEEVHRINIDNGQDMVIFSSSSSKIKLSKLMAYDGLVGFVEEKSKIKSFRIIKDKENDYWPWNEICFEGFKDTEIYLVNFRKKRIWTSIINDEIPGKKRGIICRPMENIKPGQYLKYTSGSPALWDMVKSETRTYGYFDGEVMYGGDNINRLLTRMDNSGNQFEVSCDKSDCSYIAVSEKYVYLDRHSIVQRLPKNFSSSNDFYIPEAEYPWGKDEKDYVFRISNCNI